MAEQLSWEDWQKKANATYVKGQYGVQQMIADWGYPEGMTAEGYKIEFDKGKVKRKDRVGRRAQRARATSKRQTSTQIQTVGTDIYGKGVVAPKGSGLQEHHKRVVGLYQPFFEGLNPKEAKELAQWFVDEGAPLGNVAGNLEALTEQEHEAIHNWMRKHRMQVSNRKFPSFKDVPLNERFPAALTYLEQIQPAADEELLKLQVKNGSIRLKRKAAMAAAAGGAVAPAFLGTAASAAELQTRSQIAEQTQNPVDRLQQGIAGTSLALDAASYVPVAAVPAGIASAALDVTNLAIDTGREFLDSLGSIRLLRK